MRPDEIKRQAEELSSFDGMLLSAIGEGDDLMNFGENGSNFAVQDLNQFLFTITNTATATRTSRLYSAIATEYPTVYPGLVATGAFNDIGGNAGLSGSADGSTPIETFFYYIKKNPTRINYMQINSNAAAQLQQIVTIFKINPYYQERSRPIYPSNEQNQNVFQTTIVQFKLNAQLDYEKDIQYNFVASSATTITFFMGAELNNAGALDKKHHRAKHAMKAHGHHVGGLLGKKHHKKMRE